MTLLEKLNEIPDDRTVYICAASGAILAGKKADVVPQMYELDVTLLDQLKQTAIANRIAYETLKAEDAPKETIRRAERKCHKSEDKMIDYVQLPDRVVLETYERQTEDALNIYITGDEVGKIWSLNEGSEEWRSCEVNYNVPELVTEILHGCVVEYRENFKKELQSLVAALEALQSYRTRSKTWEHFFRESSYASFLAKDPEYFISKTRAAAIEELLNELKKEGAEEHD